MSECRYLENKKETVTCDSLEAPRASGKGGGDRDGEDRRGGI